MIRAPLRRLQRALFAAFSVAALAGLAAQLAFYIEAHRRDEALLMHRFVAMEAGAIAAASDWRGDRLTLEETPALDHYSGEDARAYAYRVVDARGRVVRAHNPSLFAKSAPRPPVQDAAWHRAMRGAAFTLAGGMTSAIDGRRVSIEIVTVGDPAGRRFLALAHGALLEIVLPIVLFIAIAAAALGLALRFALPAIREEVDARARAVRTAAHELRTPLALMRLELERIEDPAARRIEHDVADLDASVAKLLNDARAAAGLIDLHAITEEVSAQLAPLADQHGRAIRVSGETPAPFPGDAAAARAAIRNLCENAIKHADGGELIEIRCGPGRQISVDDDGPGLSPEDFERLAEPFARGETRAEGSGLGLAIVRDAMASLGGKLWLDRSPRGGARFNLEFA